MEDQSEDGSDQLDLHIPIEEEVDSFIQPADEEFVESSNVKALYPSHVDEKNKPEIYDKDNTIKEENEYSLISYVTTEEKTCNDRTNISHDESVSDDFSGFAEEESIIDKKVNTKDALQKNAENPGEAVGYCSSISKHSSTIMAKKENIHPVAKTSEPKDQFQQTGNKELNNGRISSPKTIRDKLYYSNFSPSHSDVLEFAGFDSQSIDMSLEKTNKMIQILQYKEEEWTRKEILGDSAMQNIYFKSVESISVRETAERIGINIGTGDQDSTSTFPEVENIRPLTDELTLNNPPTEFGPHVNIFEEQVPSGSKRVKKKRKFFGDFEDFDGQKNVKKKSIPGSNESEPNIKSILSENKENFMTEDKLETDALYETEAVNEPQPGPVIPSKAKRAFVFDITNPLFREPFNYGWKREICYRNLPVGSKSKTAYVTYFGPQGKKFKTIRQIVEHLPPSSELGFQHFTFSVQRIFTESSPHELIRHVKNRPDLNDSSEVPAVNQAPALLDQTKPYSKKKSIHSTPKPSGLIIKKPKYLMANGANDNELLETAQSTTVLTSATPKILIKHPLSVVKSSTPKSKTGSIRKDKKIILQKTDKVTNKSILSNETVDGSFGDNSASISSPTLVKNNDDLPMTCSISCPLALGSIPTLQCTICLSLYHFECCGIDPSLPIHFYACKNCRSKTEISSELLLAVSDKCNVQNAVSSRFMSKNTKIVDGVTTWLPSSSTVQLSSRHTSVSIPQTTTQTRTSLLQSILEVDGKRYIIVPKESVVSISPCSTAFEKQSEASPIAALVDECNYVINSEEVNSGGVVLVPVMPPSDDSNALRNSFVNYERHGTGKKTISEDLEVPCTKSTKLDRELAYHSVLTLNNVMHVYDGLVSCLKYLTVRDLLRVSMSCKYLNRVASESALWSTVRLKNSKVHDWEGFARSLRKYGTKKLDMRKMLCPSSPNDLNAMWNGFLQAVPTVTSLEHIEFGRCSSNTVETVAMSCPNLVILNAVQLKDGERSHGLSMKSFAKLVNLRELRLKGSTGLKMGTGENDVEVKCKDVKILSLTSIKMLNHVTVQAISNLRNLRILELGECSNELLDQSQMAEPLRKLDNLEKLRLELVTNLDPKFELILALKDLRHLTCLELINVEVKAGFDQALVQLQSLENLFIIPMYKLEAATTNRVMLDCLFGLADRLKTCVWGVTLEVLKATMFFAANNECTIKQCEGEKPSLIPVLKHIGAKQSEVELYSLKHVDKILKTRLSNTFSKIISFPFNSSWRQSLSEQVK